MLLYHGTTAAIAHKVLEEGLKPRGENPSRWKAASNAESVYLTSAYAMHFACNAADTNEDDLAIIEIDIARLNVSNLFADEDALVHAWGAGKVDAGALNGAIGEMSIEEQAIYFSGDLKNWAADGADWQWSMQCLGNCTHRGIVSPEAISRVAYFTGHHSWWLQWHDPVVSPQNFRYMGNFYVATNLLFVGRIAEAELIDLGIMACDLSEIEKAVSDRREVIDLRLLTKMKA